VAGHFGDTACDDDVPVEDFHPCVRLAVAAVSSAAAAGAGYVPAALLASFASWPIASLPLPCHCQAASLKDVSMQTHDPHVTARQHHSKVSACRNMTHMPPQMLLQQQSRSKVCCINTQEYRSVQLCSDTRNISTSWSCSIEPDMPMLSRNIAIKTTLGCFESASVAWLGHASGHAPSNTFQLAIQKK